MDESDGIGEALDAQLRVAATVAAQAIEHAGRVRESLRRDQQHRDTAAAGAARDRIEQTSNADNALDRPARARTQRDEPTQIGAVLDEALETTSPDRARRRDNDAARQARDLAALDFPTPPNASRPPTVGDTERPRRDPPPGHDSGHERD